MSRAGFWSEARPKGDAGREHCPPLANGAAGVLGTVESSSRCDVVSATAFHESIRDF